MESETFDAITQIQAYIRQISKTFEGTVQELHEFKADDAIANPPFEMSKDYAKFIGGRAEMIFQKTKEG